MKRHHWPVLLAASLALACGGRAAQPTPAADVGCENDRALFLSSEPRTQEDLRATRAVMVEWGFLPAADSTELVTGGVAPVVVNRREILRLIVRSFPRSGPDGSWTTTVLALVDAHGRVTAARVGSASGDSALDARAVTIVRAMIFKPALHDGCRVRAQVSLPITFNKLLLSR